MNREGKNAGDYPKKPGVFWRLILKLVKTSDRTFPWYRWPLRLGVLVLAVRRAALRKFNLIPVGKSQVYHAKLSEKERKRIRRQNEENRDMYRDNEGKGNDVLSEDIGALGSYFGRNTAPVPYDQRLHDPNSPPVELVAERLLMRKVAEDASDSASASSPGREVFKPAGMQFNIMAAAWIQAMIHDWMNHEKNLQLKKSLNDGQGGDFKFHPTAIDRDNGGSKNVRTAWWDASFVYGQTEQQVKQGRAGSGGKMKEGEDNRLAVDDDGLFVVGDQENSWVGIALLQELFIKEHNAVCDLIAEKHPGLSDDELFHKARLVVAAIVAKIHTIDWTIELLKTPTLRTTMRGNWYGFLGKKIKEKLHLHTGSAILSGLVGLRRAEDHGVPFSLTEEFNAVYRMHPLMPDTFSINDQTEPLTNMIGIKIQQTMEKYDPMDLWASFLQYPCGALTLFNYPIAFRKLAPTSKRGVPESDTINLAALELWRDRERGILKYNDFRRALNMNPMKSFEQLTGKDEEMVRALNEVYDDIESVDLLVGMLAEKKISGFAISETAFHIFILMASRRLEADRFFTQDFDASVYTKEGFEWVQKTESLKDVLARHYPSIYIHEKSAFTPWKSAPQQYMV